MRKIGIVGAPIDLGAGTRGTNAGPQAIRIAGLHERLRALGHEIRDIGDLHIDVSTMNTTATDSASPRLKYLESVLAMNRSLAHAVEQVMAEGYFPLILGGDHSIAIGSIAGITKRKKNIGVIWYDAHGDMNTDETTPSGNIHGMPLAANLGLGHKVLTEFGGSSPKVKRDHVVIVGARDLDKAERELIRQVGVRVFTMEDIDRRGMAAIMEETLHIATSGTEGVHLSLDLDALDPFYTPGVGTPVNGGITYRESRLAMEMIAQSGSLLSADFVEVNPTLDRDNRTAHVAVNLIATVLGEELL